MSDIDIKADVQGLELYSDQYPFRLSLRIQNFESEADYKKFINNCKKIVRGCLEYKQWKNYIIDVLGVNTCMITDERIDECPIEVHHHIPSMYVLISALINKHVEKEERFSTFDIAQRAIELHFQNKIGYVTLISDLHKKFHNGYLKIPKEMIRGDYDFFLKEYGSFVDDDDMDSINQRLSVTMNNCSDYPYKWSRNNYPDSIECVG